MLPTLTLADLFRSTSRDTHVSLPCSLSPSLHSDPSSRLKAAEACARCPIAPECLTEAMRLDAAYRVGRDRFGVTGCLGGVWFEQQRPPKRILRAGRLVA